MSVILKINFQDQDQKTSTIRRCVFDTAGTDSYDRLLKVVKDTVPANHDFVIKFLDDEDELCTIASAAELSEAASLISQLGRNNVKLFVTSIKKPAVPEVKKSAAKQPQSSVVKTIQKPVVAKKIQSSVVTEQPKMVKIQKPAIQKLNVLEIKEIQKSAKPQVVEIKRHTIKKPVRPHTIKKKPVVETQGPPKAEAKIDQQDSKLALPSAPLRYGHRGPGVARLQHALIQLGFMDPSAIRWHVGFYGPRTTEAVAKVSRAMGLDEAVHGVFTDVVRQCLQNLLGEGKAPAPSESADDKENAGVKPQQSQQSQCSVPCFGRSYATPCPLMLAPAVFLFWSIFGCTATVMVGMLACLRKVLPRPMVSTGSRLHELPWRTYQVLILKCIWNYWAYYKL